MPPKRRTLSASLKSSIAASQSHICSGVDGYACPLSGKTFDQSGFQIDHIVELADGGTDDVSNLQALCPSCHSVKTQLSARKRKSKKSSKSVSVSSKAAAAAAVLEAISGKAATSEVDRLLAEKLGWTDGATSFMRAHKIPFSEDIRLAQGDGMAIVTEYLTVHPKKLCSVIGYRPAVNRLVSSTDLLEYCNQHSRFSTTTVDRQVKNAPMILDCKEGAIKNPDDLKGFLQSKGVPFREEMPCYGRCHCLKIEYERLRDSLPKTVYVSG